MPRKVILHVTGEDPIVGEIDTDPQPSDVFVKVSNVKKRDGKDVAGIDPRVQTVIYPWHRITFLELLPSEEERSSVIDFFRT